MMAAFGSFNRASILCFGGLPLVIVNGRDSLVLDVAGELLSAVAKSPLELDIDFDIRAPVY